MRTRPNLAANGAEAVQRGSTEDGGGRLGEDWAVFLVPYLTGKARSTYVAMNMDHATDRVKVAILHKYAINEKVYRRRFREPDVRPGESRRELYTRLRDLFEKWIRPADKSVEEVAEANPRVARAQQSWWRTS